MKKIICLFVMFLISNAVNAEQWEYCSLQIHIFSSEKRGKTSQLIQIHKNYGTIQWSFDYPPTPKKPPIIADKKEARTSQVIAQSQLEQIKDLTGYKIKNEAMKRQEIPNVLGRKGWELVNGLETHEKGLINKSTETFYFKRKISK